MVGYASAKKGSASNAVVVDQRRRRKKVNASHDDVKVREEETKEDVEGYDPLTGQVLGPEGQPVGPGNGSVVIRDITSEQVSYGVGQC